MIWHELGPFTIFDVETTGMSPENDRIVELAAVRVDRDGSLTRFQSLINPGRRIPPKAVSVHHITDEMVSGAPRFAEVGRRFLTLAEESTLVAHNAFFDLGFLVDERPPRRCRRGVDEAGAGHQPHRSAETLRQLSCGAA